jgi:hypothetical protein
MSRIFVVYDKQGNIVSAGRAERRGLETYDYLAPQYGPGVMDGQSVAEVQVPDDYAETSLLDIQERMRVQAKGGAALLVAREG